MESRSQMVKYTFHDTIITQLTHPNVFVYVYNGINDNERKCMNIRLVITESQTIVPQTIVPQTTAQTPTPTQTTAQTPTPTQSTTSPNYRYFIECEHQPNFPGPKYIQSFEPAFHRLEISGDCKTIVLSIFVKDHDSPVAIVKNCGISPTQYYWEFHKLVSQLTHKCNSSWNIIDNRSDKCELDDYRSCSCGRKNKLW